MRAGRTAALVQALQCLHIHVVAGTALRRRIVARVAWLLTAGLPAAPVVAQAIAGPAGPAAGSTRWDGRFDLSQLPPPTPTAGRDTRAGGDVEIAPNLVAGLGADDRQRGVERVVDGVAPVFQRQAEVSARLGMTVGDRGLLYGRVGYAEFDLAQAFDRTGGRTFSTNGVAVGGGAEARLTPSLSLTTEYHSVDYRGALSDRQLLGGVSLRY